MDSEFLRELRQKYIQNPPEGMTAKLVQNMSDSDLLDMHDFLTEDDNLDDNDFEEGFYIFTMKQKLSDSQKSANYPYQNFNCSF